MKTQHELKAKVLRYLVGGASTTVLTWGSVWVLVEWFDLHYLIATNAATVIAYLYSYFVNKVFVFQNKDRDHVFKGTQFLILQLSLVAFTNVFMYVAVSMLDANYMFAVIVVSIINAFTSFTLMQTLIFFSRQST